MDKYLGINKRFVFFTERRRAVRQPERPGDAVRLDRDGQGRLSTGDAGLFVWWTSPPATVRSSQPFRGYMMDQDTGGASARSGRCDIYMGVGADAERIAGHQLHAGELYYLAVKLELIEQYTAATGVAAK